MLLLLSSAAVKTTLAGDGADVLVLSLDSVLIAGVVSVLSVTGLSDVSAACFSACKTELMIV